MSGSPQNWHVAEMNCAVMADTAGSASILRNFGAVMHVALGVAMGVNCVPAASAMRNDLAASGVMRTSCS
jgi:hypothetical protein